MRIAPTTCHVIVYLVVEFWPSNHKKGNNVMPHCIDAVKNLATLQEICDVYREVYGEYRDPGLY